jgi:hypothetical protein
MVVGRRKGESAGEGVDILLPEIPWGEQAIVRTRNHEVDFGFGKVPVLTVEDVVLAKLYPGLFTNVNNPGYAIQVPSSGPRIWMTCNPSLPPRTR